MEIKKYSNNNNNNNNNNLKNPKKTIKISKIDKKIQFVDSFYIYFYMFIFC